MFVKKRLTDEEESLLNFSIKIKKEIVDPASWSGLVYFIVCKRTHIFHVFIHNTPRRWTVIIEIMCWSISWKWKEDLKKRRLGFIFSVPSTKVFKYKLIVFWQ